MNAELLSWLKEQQFRTTAQIAEHLDMSTTATYRRLVQLRTAGKVDSLEQGHGKERRTAEFVVWHVTGLFD